MREPQPTTRLPQFRKGYRVWLTIPDGNRPSPTPTRDLLLCFDAESIMPTPVSRQTVDLGLYPDLVVVYLGMRVNRIAGLKTLIGFGPKISKSVAAQPDGLLRHENFVFSLFPMHAGMRQYWRDMDSLLKWTRSQPHRDWWKNFLRDSGGTGFWHETYTLRGGMEAIYDDIAVPIGFSSFAPVVPARGSMFTAAHRTAIANTAPPVVNEEDLYGSPPPKTR